MKQAVKAYVYAWVSDSGQLGDFQLSTYQMCGENWVCVFKNEEGEPKLIEIEVEIPAEFHRRWQQLAVANVDKEMGRVQAEARRRLLELGEMKEKLLAIEYRPGVER